VEQLVVSEIHPEDAFYDWKDRFIGKPAEWIDCEDSPQKGWYAGNLNVDGKVRHFHAIKTKPIHVGKDGQEGEKQRITPYGNLYKRKLRTPKT